MNEQENNKAFNVECHRGSNFSADYFDQYEIEFERNERKIQKTKFEKIKMWFNDVVRDSIILKIFSSSNNK